MTTISRLSLAVLCVVGLLASGNAVAGAKRLYIANDDHTDYMWSADDVQYRAAFLSMLDYYMTQAEATVANPPDSRGRFSVDGSLWVWEYEHNKSAAAFDRLIGHLRDGTITMPLNTAVLCYGGSPAEAVLRSMYYAGSLERRYNLRFPLVEAMENQTLPGGVASLWAGSGALYSWRGVCGCASKTVWGNRPREIYQFTGPDGQSVCMKWNTLQVSNAAMGGYAEGRSPTNIVTFMDTDPTYTGRWPWPVSAAFGYGADDLQTTVSSFISAAQSMSNASRRVIVSNEVDFFQDFVASYGSQIPVFSGSFGNEWELYQASLAAVTAGFRDEIEKLRTAEALATVASLNNPSFMNGRQAARDLAFIAAGMFYEHDWTADGPVGRTRRAQFQRDMLTNLKNYVDPLQADALAAVAGQVARPAGVERHLVFNPLSWRRTDFVDLTVAQAPPLKVVNTETGEEVPSQVLSTGPTVVRILTTDVPSIGYRVYEVQPGQGAQFPPATTVALPAFDNGFYGVTVGPRGNLISLVDHRDAHRELVNIANGSLNDLGLGAGTVVIESSGPVSTTLKILAGGSPAHETRVTLYAGFDRIDIDNRITQNFNTSMAYTSTFDLPGSTTRHEEVGMIAKVARAAQGGDYADANARTDYQTFGHFVDVSQVGRGVTVSNWDSPFFQAGNSTAMTLDGTTPSIKAVVGMQVDGTAFGILSQGGDSFFRNRYSLRTHAAYDPATAMRFALEHQNPLVSTPLTGTAAGPLPATNWALVALASPDLLVWALKPAEEGIGQGVIARVWNLADNSRQLDMTLLPNGLVSAQHTTHIETNVSPATVVGGALNDQLARQQMKTYRLFPAALPGNLATEGPAFQGRLSAAVFPNPLPRSQSSTISFMLPMPGRAKVAVNDLAGARVATVLEEALTAGRHQVVWNLRNARNETVRPGMYFIVVEALGQTTARPLVVLE